MRKHYYSCMWFNIVYSQCGGAAGRISFDAAARGDAAASHC